MGKTGKFDGCVLVSDFDGTLIDSKLCISDENISAINAFVAEGGRFLGATGRTELNVRPYVGGIALSLPWILYNGAAIYDWTTESFIHTEPLPRGSSGLFLHRVMDRYPSINIQVFTGGPFFLVNPKGSTDVQAHGEGQAHTVLPMDDVPGDWLKVLFCSDDPAVIGGIQAMLDDDPLGPQVHGTHSGPRYFEMTAAGVNKGSALAWLKERLEPAPRYVVAIGDYLNDVEMLRVADLGAAPESAMAAVKNVASIITRDHNRSAVADLIGRLDAYLPMDGSPPHEADTLSL